MAEPSIQLELVLVVDAKRGSCSSSSDMAVADRKNLDVGAHETAEASSGPNDRLAADVEAGIDHHPAAGQPLKADPQLVIARVGVGVHGLHAPNSRCGHGGDRRARNIELVDPEQSSLSAVISRRVTLRSGRPAACRARCHRDRTRFAHPRATPTVRTAGSFRDADLGRAPSASWASAGPKDRAVAQRPRRTPCGLASSPPPAIGQRLPSIGSAHRLSRRRIARLRRSQRATLHR